MASSEPSPANGSNQTRSDEELMLELARGSHEALGPLYTRYARLVYHLAAQSLDRAAAEELVQEVFLTMLSRDPRSVPGRPRTNRSCMPRSTRCRPNSGRLWHSRLWMS
jgi:hypothetical protein